MIGIVGGGISGLALAHYLRAQGVAHIVLEREAVPGGVMRTRVVDGKPLDLGPQRTRLTADVSKLVADLRLTDQLMAAPSGLPVWVYRRGRLRKVPFSLKDLLATDLLGPLQKIRLLLEPFTGSARSDESVARFLTRKFGREAYEAFLGPFYGGLYASDPARMQTRHGLSAMLQELDVGGSVLLAVLRRGLRARRSLPAVSFRRGMGELTASLATAAAESFRPATPVALIEQRKGGFLLHVEPAGGHAPVAVAQVVLCVPAKVASRLLSPVAAAAAERLAGLRTNRLAVVHLSSECGLRGFGYQVAFGEALETRGVTFNDSMFDRRGVYTAYLGGMQRPELVDWQDGRIARQAADEFRLVTGCAARPLLVSRTQIPAWDESWDLLEGLQLPDGVTICANWYARPGIPGRLAQARRVARSIAGTGSVSPTTT